MFIISIATANVCNVYMMRQNELKEGVDVEDENGVVVGSSKVAAKKVRRTQLINFHTLLVIF